MTDTKTIREQLAAPFPPESISWRVGTTTKDKSRGLALAYLTARDVMDRLDDVFGIDGWSDEYKFEGMRIVCTIRAAATEPSGWRDGWVSKTDAAGETNIEGEKGGVSDAFKRAAVKWGIGRYLYHLDSPWVELDDYKRIKKSEYAKLNRLLGMTGGGPGRVEGGVPLSAPEAPSSSVSQPRKVTANQLAKLYATNRSKCEELGVTERQGADLIKVTLDEWRLKTSKDLVTEQLGKLIGIIDGWTASDFGG
jgi:hypothetical protein